MRVAPALLAVGTLVGARVALADVTVAVDPSSGAHAISPYIYGMNFASQSQIAKGGLMLTRWGGNSTTRYNYQIDVTNTASDYYFENVAGCWTGADGYCSTRPSDPMTDSGANAFIQGALNAQMHALLTIPTIGFVSKGPPPYSQPLPCGCPRSADSNQDSFDQYDSNCGNGKSGGQWTTCPDPETTTSQAVQPQWSQDWVAYLVTQFGPSNGQVIYELDNEPNLWSSTHHDVHPTRLTYDELWQRMQQNAVAILQADPTALMAGFEEWGWPNYLCSDMDTATGGCSSSSPDRSAHGGEDLTSWILDQAAAYEQQNGQRILHALDLHYYPQGGSAPDNLRSLWDPTYTDPSWISSIIRLIPRMHDWVDQHYPGTLIGISEYQWPNYDTGLGAVTYAEILGIFGQQGLDYATAWSGPTPSDNAFAAFQLYRNYDGAGAAFQGVGVNTTVTGSSFQAYASANATQMTVVLVNEAGSAVPAHVSFGNFEPSGSATYYEINGTNIVPSSVTLSGGATVYVSAITAGLLVINGTNPNMLPTAPDGGTPDAGRPDAGVGDAGAPDAGALDAGARDAGTIDAGEEDAGERDAGEADAGHQADAGALDAGEADAGHADAGRPDAGESDAGHPDAGEADAGHHADAGEADAGRSEVDAGRSDAGHLDAGVPDAGTVDGGESDAGEGDAGSETVDAGTPDAGSTLVGGNDAGTPMPGPPAPSRGCGCGSPGADVSLGALWLLVLRRRVRRSTTA
jgi:hypothetical protein